MKGYISIHHSTEMVPEEPGGLLRSMAPEDQNVGPRKAVSTVFHAHPFRESSYCANISSLLLKSPHLASTGQHLRQCQKSTPFAINHSWTGTASFNVIGKDTFNEAIRKIININYVVRSVNQTPHLSQYC